MVDKGTFIGDTSLRQIERTHTMTNAERAKTFKPGDRVLFYFRGRPSLGTVRGEGTFERWR
jgi:hypothetical protein